MNNKVVFAEDYLPVDLLFFFTKRIFSNHNPIKNPTVNIKAVFIIK
jgi:hypothetical protein